MLNSMEIKFFPRDVVSGEAEKEGDKFVAFFITGTNNFVVTKHCGEFFFATIVREDN